MPGAQVRVRFFKVFTTHMARHQLMRMESGLSAGVPCHASAPVMLVMGSPEGGVSVAGALKGLQAESVFPPAQK